VEPWKQTVEGFAMSEIVERSLADVDTSVDVSPVVTPENFDLAEWAAGVRPTQRSVKLYPNAHLIARMDELADKIDNAPEGADVDALIDEFETVREQFREGVWFTVEKRSSEWIQHQRSTTAKRLGIKLDEDFDAENSADNITLMLHQLAEQVVRPRGVTPDMLRSMYDANEGELVKLSNAMQTANRQLAESSGVLDRDFSGRRSHARRTS
jgi:hypothetical protein